MRRSKSFSALSFRLERLRAFRRDRRGVAAIELAIVSPVVLLIMVATVDFGLVLYTRLSLNEAVSASASFAIAKSSQASAAQGAGLASNLAAIMHTKYNVTATVNNGPTVTRTNGTPVSTGTASNADSCYCPTVSGSTVTWGSAVVCGNSCGTTGRAGKFVSISASVAHSPLFSNYGYVQNGAVSAFTMVQVQ